MISQGATWYQACPDMCQKEEGMGSFSVWSEQNEWEIVIKMGARFVASLFVGETFLDILYEVMCNSAGTELQ